MLVILGLDWQPVRTSAGVTSTILSRTIDPDTSGTIENRIYWPSNKDFGVKDWLDTNWNGSSYDNDCYLWIGSTCVLPKTSVATNPDGLEYYVDCHPAQFNSPNENVFASVDNQSIFVTNYPQSIGGMTANLFGVEIDSAGNNNSGTQPFRMRTGKVQPGTTDNGMGQWKVNVGGFTDQLKIKAPTERFNARLSGYKFNNIDIVAGDVPNTVFDYNHAPHISVIEHLPTGSAPVQVNIDLPVDVNGYVEYDNPGDIVKAIAAQMNLSVALNCTYTEEEGDLKWYHATNNYRVYVHGIVPFVCGLGYIKFAKIKTLLNEVLADPYGTPECFTLNLRTDINFQTYEDGSLSVVDDINSSYWAQLQKSELDGVDIWQGGIRNPATCAYFYQYDLSQAVDAKDLQHPYFRLVGGHGSVIPADTAGNNRLYYTNTSDVEPILGDNVAFGEVVRELYQHTATISAVGDGYLELVDDEMVGLPWSLFWCNGIADKIFNDAGYREAMQEGLDYLASANNNSPANKDGEVFTAGTVDDLIADYTFEKINADNPVDIFKQLLGDPDTDVGVPVALRNTAINDLFDRGSANSLGLIDFDTLYDLIELNRISGATFTLVADEKDGRAKDIDVLDLIRNVAMTHGIRAVWQWNETIRSWWLTFKSEGLGSYAEALNGGRVVHSGSVINKPINGTLGGDWYYTGITSEYKRTDGGDETFNFKNLDSRIQHTLKDKILSISDKVTVLPSDTTDARAQIISKFSTYLQTFSTVQYKVTLDATFDSLANVSVGSGMLFNLRPLLDRTVGRRDNGDQLGEVRSLTIDMGNNPGMRLELITEPTERLGIGPTMYLTGVIRSVSPPNVLTCSGITDPANNDFQDPVGLTDLEYFGCYDYVESTGETVARDGCTCGDYAVTIFERDAEALYYDPAGTYSNQNVWRGTLNIANNVTGAYTITVTALNNTTQFDAVNNAGAGKWVVIFADRAAALQPCQTVAYGWLGDSSGQVENSTGGKSSAILVRG
jgi:hypothetical protein